MWDVYLNTHFSAHLMMSSIPPSLMLIKDAFSLFKKKIQYQKYSTNSDIIKYD